MCPIVPGVGMRATALEEKIVLQKREYVRLIDRLTGLERVATRPDLHCIAGSLFEQALVFLSELQLCFQEGGPQILVPRPREAMAGGSNCQSLCGFVEAFRVQCCGCLMACAVAPEGKPRLAGVAFGCGDEHSHRPHQCRACGEPFHALCMFCAFRKVISLNALSPNTMTPRAVCRTALAQLNGTFKPMATCL